MNNNQKIKDFAEALCNVIFEEGKKRNFTIGEGVLACLSSAKFLVYLLMLENKLKTETIEKLQELDDAIMNCLNLIVEPKNDGVSEVNE